MGAPSVFPGLNSCPSTPTLLFTTLNVTPFAMSVPPKSAFLAMARPQPATSSLAEEEFLELVESTHLHASLATFSDITGTRIDGVHSFWEHSHGVLSTHAAVTCPTSPPPFTSLSISSQTVLATAGWAHVAGNYWSLLSDCDALTVFFHSRETVALLHGASGTGSAVVTSPPSAHVGGQFRSLARFTVNGERTLSWSSNGTVGIIATKVPDGKVRRGADLYGVFPTHCLWTTTLRYLAKWQGKILDASKPEEIKFELLQGTGDAYEKPDSIDSVFSKEVILHRHIPELPSENKDNDAEEDEDEYDGIFDERVHRRPTLRAHDWAYYQKHKPVDVAVARLDAVTPLNIRAGIHDHIIPKLEEYSKEHPRDLHTKQAIWYLKRIEGFRKESLNAVELETYHELDTSTATGLTSTSHIGGFVFGKMAHHGWVLHRITGLIRLPLVMDHLSTPVGPFRNGKGGNSGTAFFGIVGNGQFQRYEAAVFGMLDATVIPSAFRETPRGERTVCFSFHDMQTQMADMATQGTNVIRLSNDVSATAVWE